MHYHSRRVWLGAWASTLGEGCLPSVWASSVLSWHLWWTCHPWFRMCIFIWECTHCWSLAGHTDVSPSSDNREDKSFLDNPLDLSSAFSENTEDGFVRFLSTPLFDSSDHEDANEIIDFSDCGYRDPFTPIFDHDHDSIAIDFSKPLFTMI